MATSDIEKVLTVFQGIANRDADLATKYMDPQKYKEHRFMLQAGGLADFCFRTLSKSADYAGAGS
jgi:hypothetical protein